MDNNTLAILGSALMSVLTFLGVGAKVLKYVKALKESIDVGTAVALAVSAEGDGGSTVTKTEIDKIKKELEEAKEAWKI